MAFTKLNSMKFIGLDGLSHFWSKAKTWIINRITTEVTAKIAEIVANAPEDLDTLKEIADWISAHANDAAAMNTAISTNTSDIATLKTTVAGKSDTGHTHTKSEITDFPTSLPANGGTATKATQDGSGNNIASTYMPKSGGTFSGSVEFDQPTYFNDEIHSSCLFPKNSIDSFFSFFKDTTDNYLPRVYGYNCGDVFNNDMCLRYYKCNYTSMSVALNNLNQLKKLFASMYPYETDGCARCTSIHVTINVSFTDGKPAIIGDIINYGYCNSDDIARVNKDGSVYVGEDFYSNYHVLYISYDDGFKEKDAYYLANEILKNGMRHINHFSFIGNYVLAEHL